MKTYKLEDGKIAHHDFSNLTMGEITDGPYFIVFQSESFPIALCFAGMNEDMQRVLYSKNKCVQSITSLWTYLIHFAAEHSHFIDMNFESIIYYDLIEILKKCRDAKNKDTDFHTVKKETKKSVDGALL